MNDVGEITILEEADVRITNLRAVIGTKTYALSDVISVRMTKEGSIVGCLIAALISGALLLGLFSLVSATYNSGYCFTAFIFLGAAIVVALLAQPTYNIQIRSLSGNEDILQSMDGDYLKRIVDAINDAIVYELTDDEAEVALRL